jgi:hypothetical protein
VWQPEFDNFVNAPAEKEKNNKFKGALTKADSVVTSSLAELSINQQ